MAHLLVLQNAVTSLQSVTAVIQSLNSEYPHARFVPETNDMFVNSVTYMYEERDVDKDIEADGDDHDQDMDDDTNHEEVSSISMSEVRLNSSISSRSSDSKSGSNWAVQNLTVNGLSLKVRAGMKVRFPSLMSSDQR